MPKEPYLFTKKLYNKSYFEAARRPRKRSLLMVNEHFEGKADAKRALLYNFLLDGFYMQHNNSPLTILLAQATLYTTGDFMRLHHR